MKVTVLVLGEWGNSDVRLQRLAEKVILECKKGAKLVRCVKGRADFVPPIEEDRIGSQSKHPLFKSTIECKLTAKDLMEAIQAHSNALAQKSHALKKRDNYNQLATRKSQWHVEELEAAIGPIRTVRVESTDDARSLLELVNTALSLLSQRDLEDVAVEVRWDSSIVQRPPSPLHPGDLLVDTNWTMPSARATSSRASTPTDNMSDVDASQRRGGRESPSELLSEVGFSNRNNAASKVSRHRPHPPPEHQTLPKHLNNTTPQSLKFVRPENALSNSGRILAHSVVASLQKEDGSFVVQLVHGASVELAGACLAHELTHILLHLIRPPHLPHIDRVVEEACCELMAELYLCWRVGEEAANVLQVLREEREEELHEVYSRAIQAFEKGWFPADFLRFVSRSGDLPLEIGKDEVQLPEAFK